MLIFFAIPYDKVMMRDVVIIWLFLKKSEVCFVYKNIFLVTK